MPMLYHQAYTNSGFAAVSPDTTKVTEEQSKKIDYEALPVAALTAWKDNVPVCDTSDL